MQALCRLAHSLIDYHKIATRKRRINFPTQEFQLDYSSMCNVAHNGVGQLYNISPFLYSKATNISVQQNLLPALAYCAKRGIVLVLTSSRARNDHCLSPPPYPSQPFPNPSRRWKRQKIPQVSWNFYVPLGRTVNPFILLNSSLFAPFVTSGCMCTFSPDFWNYRPQKLKNDRTVSSYRYYSEQWYTFQYKFWEIFNDGRLAETTEVTLEIR